MAYHLNQADYEALFAQDLLSIGEITLTSGQIIVHDPYILADEDSLPFLHPVPKGKFPVQLALKRFPNGDVRVAFARILFSETPAKYFELGVTIDTLHEELGEEEFCGAVSDSGYLAFADAEIINKLPQNEKEALKFVKELESALKINFQNTFSHQNYQNLYCFTAGWGNGLYPVFFAYEREPENEALFPVAVVVDLLLE